MKKVGLGLLAFALFVASCQDKKVEAPVIEEANVETVKDEVETKELRLSGETMDMYMDSEDAMMVSLGEKDQMRLQKAIQIIGNMNVFYAEDDGIDNDKTDAEFLKIVGSKTFKQVCDIAEGYLKADKQRELDRINDGLGSIRSPKSESEKDRYNEFMKDREEANQMSVTLDEYVYNEECFL